VGASTWAACWPVDHGHVTSIVHLTAPIHFTTILIAFAGALVGGLIAGAIGGWRAARLAPPQPSETSADGRGTWNEDRKGRQDDGGDSRDETAEVSPGRSAGTPLRVVALERTFAKGGVSVKAVRGVDLVIKTGDMVSLEGPSGSGKTTLLQLLGALDSPTGGTIRFEGRDLAGSATGS